MIQTQLALHVRRLVGDDHIGRPDQIHQLRAPLVRTQIKRHAFLVAVDRRKPQRRIVQKRRPPMTRVIPAGAFNLDHLGAEIG